MFQTYKNNLSTKIDKYLRKLKKYTNPIKFIIFVYAFVALCLVATYYYAWVIMWLGGKENLPSLLSLFKEYTSPAVVGFITFVALSTVDSDGDGIPDSIDKHDDRKDDEEEPPQRGRRKE